MPKSFRSRFATIPISGCLNYLPPLAPQGYLLLQLARKGGGCAEAQEGEGGWDGGDTNIHGDGVTRESCRIGALV